MRAYLCTCIVFCIALKPLDDPYPDLIAQKFLAFYTVRVTSKGIVADFRKKHKGQSLALYKTQYSNAKTWTTKFFFVTGQG